LGNSVLRRFGKGDISIFTEGLAIETAFKSCTIPIISSCKQQEVLETLQGLIPFEQFYMVVVTRIYCIRR
jgi:hypothetical protein